MYLSPFLFYCIHMHGVQKKGGHKPIKKYTLDVHIVSILCFLYFSLWEDPP